MFEGERCAALYLFDERSGNRVHNQIKPGVDLTIPERYQILDQTFLMPFWEEFDFSWGYWKNAAKNVVGFVPLGFFLYAYFSLKLPVRRAALITVALGCLVSVTIEVLQALSSGPGFGYDRHHYEYVGNMGGGGSVSVLAGADRANVSRLKGS